MKKRLFETLLFVIAVSTYCPAQIVINEVLSSGTLLQDEDGDTPDWIELYNPSGSSVNLEGYTLFDAGTAEDRWVFPAVTLGSGKHLLLLASDKDRREVPLHWHTLIDLGDEWKYLIPDKELVSSWRTIGFDDTGWLSGPSGFGFGDNDDNTVIVQAGAVFIRKEFWVSEIEHVGDMLLHIDYDDAFVAFINGQEVARGNITSDGPPPFDAYADNYDHEARMYSGGEPESFTIDPDILNAGENVIAIQVHNANATSSDLTAIPFLSVGYRSVGDYRFSEHLKAHSSYLHLNFKISGDGDQIYLYSNSSLMDSLVIPSLIPDVSYGRKPDGTTSWVFFNDPTPGSPNSTDGSQNFGKPVVFSEEAGYYTGSFQLELTSEQDAPIYYTTDGADPLVSGQLYTASLTINRTMVVRAVVREEGVISGLSQSSTYFVNHGHTLPIISVTTDPKNLWDYNEGIYVMGPNAESQVPHHGANFWQDWEKPVHVEMFEPNGERAFAENAGVKIFGAWSRAHDQKSLAIYFRKAYGVDKIEYPVFPGLNLQEFSHLVLRNSGNDWNNTMFRDGLITSLFHEAIDKPAFRSAVVYLNGEYWGIHNLREKVNEDFLANHHDLDPDDLTILEADAVPVEGDETHYEELMQFISSNDLANEDNYEQVETQMDVDNFIFYVTGNIYVDNKDWPGNNIKYWRENAPGGKWRWIAYDTDFGFDIWDEGFVTYNTLNFALEANGPGWPNPPWSTFLLRNLMQNEEFKNKFINAFADQFNTTWQPSVVVDKVNALEELINGEIRDHLDLWDGSFNYWTERVEGLRRFAQNRPENVRNHIRSRFQLGPDRRIELDVNDRSFGGIRLNMLHLKEFPWSGSYFEGAPVVLEAVPNPGYRFLRWEGDLSSDEQIVAVPLTATTSITAVFELSNPELVSIVINEINYNSDKDFDTEDWVEFYNKGDQPIDISGWQVADGSDNPPYTFASETVMPADSYLVVCRDLPAFEALNPGVESALGNMEFGLSADGDCVRLTHSDGTLLDEVCFSAIAPWPEAANGTGATLGLKLPYLDNGMVESWIAQGQPGTPGAVNDFTLSTTTDRSERLLLYPNPGSGALYVRYRLASNERVRLSIHDMSGRLLEVIREEEANAGELRIYWEGELESGLYLVRLETQSGLVSTGILIRN